MNNSMKVGLHCFSYACPFSIGVTLLPSAPSPFDLFAVRPAHEKTFISLFDAHGLSIPS